MFDSLTDRLGSVFDKLTRRGALSEGDVDAALREVRQALLEADVALPVARDFIAKVRERAVGEEVVKSVTPGQMVVKIVNDALVETLGSEAVEINLNAVPPAPIMMVGLQGSGKTTSTAKLAKRLVERDKKKVMMASLDTRRPAAMEQLKILGEQIDVPTLPIVEGQNPVDIAKRAMQSARLQGFDIILLDTAGRMHVDEALMAEVQAVHGVAQPVETLLVADALTGQDAVNLGRDFHEKIGITGLPRSGKSAVLEKVIKMVTEERKHNLGRGYTDVIGGVLTEAIIEDGERVGYACVNIRTGEKGTIAHREFDI